VEKKQVALREAAFKSSPPLRKKKGENHIARLIGGREALGRVSIAPVDGRFNLARKYETGGRDSKRPKKQQKGEQLNLPTRSLPGDQIPRGKGKKFNFTYLDISPLSEGPFI